MKKYRSKISWGLVLLFLLIVVGSSLPILSPPIWPALLLNMGVLIFFVHLLASTYYVIDGQKLIVRSSLLVNTTIDISAIDSVSETRTLISAPAASLDRLQVDYGLKCVIISPKDKAEFIAHLTRINPEIEVSYRPIK